MGHERWRGRLSRLCSMQGTFENWRPWPTKWPCPLPHWMRPNLETHCTPLFLGGHHFQGLWSVEGWWPASSNGSQLASDLWGRGLQQRGIVGWGSPKVVSFVDIGQLWCRPARPTPEMSWGAKVNKTNALTLTIYWKNRPISCPNCC